MNVASILDGVTSFIMDPSRDDRKPLTQGIAWVTTIIVGIGTAGIAHEILSKVVFEVHSVPSNFR